MSSDPSLIQISLAAIAKMVKFDLDNPGRETAGLLIGEEKDSIVYIDDVRLGDQKGNAVHVEVDDMELTQAAIEISERRDGKVIVGWIHTHPGLSAFLSSTDIRTQTHYQALMPNAIAIVMDPVKYGETQNIDDLDLKIFRVIDGKAKEYRYMISKSVEFGLNTYVTGSYTIGSTQSALPSVYQIKVPSRDKIRSIRQSVKINKEYLEDSDVEALHIWLDLVEAMESGDSVEVPIEVNQIIEQLDTSLNEIKNEIDRLNDDLEYRKAERTLFFILFGVFIEFAAFYMYYFL